MSLGSLPISGSSSRPHVLVADDDPAVRRLIVRALIAAAFEVSEAPDGRTAAHLVAQIRSVTRLCGEMGISVVAEGIETPEERTSVIDLGCSLLQGYLLSRPGAPLPEVAW